MKGTIHERMERLGISEEELVETFARASGPGGQHVNKVSTSVTLRWRNFSVTVQESRSQSANRQLARLRLCELVEKARATRAAKRKAAAALKRRRNSPRPRGLKERILETKRRRSSIKKLRSRPQRGDD
jgi:protein subunit release factor B